MYEFIKRLLFYKSKDRPILQASGAANDVKKSPCSLEFEMNLDGTVNIICSWPEFTEDNTKHLVNLANHYALMIDAINSGLLNRDICDTLQNHSSDKYMDILFAQNVYYKIIELNFLRKEQEKSSIPLIKPSQVFKQA